MVDLTERDALIALAASSWSSYDLLPREFEIDGLFERGILANRRDITDEVETILTKTGREQVRAAVERALSGQVIDHSDAR